MPINKYLPFAVIYFFFNALGLPFGLTWTAILAPYFYWWGISTSGKEPLLPFLVFLAPFLIIHFVFGVDTGVYLLSVANYVAVFIFSFAVHTFFRHSEAPELIFQKLLSINFLFCLVAIPIYFTSFDDVLWMQQNLTDGADNVRRFKLFTYESSHYAMTFAPLFFFYFFGLILNQNKINSWLLLVMILLPLILSFSIGVIGSIFIALVIVCIVHTRSLLRKRRFIYLMVLGTCVVFIASILLVFIFQDNTLGTRIGNIIAGTDTSGKGRTTDAFTLAIEIARQKSIAFGVGAGHIKILGADIIKSFYLYDLDYNKIAIPNAVAETLAIFGGVGFTVRILIQLALFMLTRVWTNYFRFALFCFVFIYQFTGSFITNVTEYVIWILAFTNVFPEFDVQRKKTEIHLQ